MLRKFPYFVDLFKSLIGKHLPFYLQSRQTVPVWRPRVKRGPLFAFTGLPDPDRISHPLENPPLAFD